MIPYGRQDITEEDIQAVVDALKSEFLTQGPVVPRFERLVADYVGAAHGVAVNSATSALHIACLALGLGPGDILWTTPVTFVASANCGLYCGANVDFVDIDPQTYNLDPVALALKLELAEREGSLPKVIVAVHMCGQSCDMVAIHEMSIKYGFHIIEDASHAIGALYRGEFVGNCRYSDITVFSFHPVKLVTTGEGGMALTQNSKLADRMVLLRSHGITRDSEQMNGQSEGAWYYQQLSLGFNYRMTDFQAALGASQLLRLETYINRRRELALRYDLKLSGLNLRIPWQHPDTLSAFHLYVIRCEETSRRKVFEYMRNSGIGVNVHYIPVHLHPYYRKLGFLTGDFPSAEAYYKEAITIPLFPVMSDEDQLIVVDVLAEALNRTSIK